MPSKRSRTKKSNRIVARSISKKIPFTFRSPLFLLVVLAVAILGGYFLYKSFALTNTVTYSGSFTKKHPNVSYNVTATADGTVTAAASYNNVQNFQMLFISSSGQSIAATSSGTNPLTISAPITKGTYAIALSGIPAGKSSGSYTVTISYPVTDTIPPAAAIASPASGSTISGQTNITGTATDNDGVSKLEVSVDGASYVLANLTGTSTTNQTWSYLFDTTKLSNATHNVTVKATDLTGNISTTTATYSVNNAVVLTDTTPPTISISSPVSGTGVSGITTFQGSASDNTGVSKVQYKLDNATTWSAASGTTSWSFNVDTTTLTNNASHVVYVQALDAANNASTTSETVTVSNITYTTAAPSSQGTWVSPEGVTITVNSAGVNPASGQPWTIADIYSLLKSQTTANSTVASIFNAFAPKYKLNVQDQYSSMTTTSATNQNGVYSNYQATTYLKGLNSTFNTYPDYVMGHEYGEAWTQYGYFLGNHPNKGMWVDYTSYRQDNSTYNGSIIPYLYQDPRLASSQSWQPAEIIADDYRLLFGSPSAISERNYGINTAITDPRNQTALGNWLLTSWR